MSREEAIAATGWVEKSREAATRPAQAPPNSLAPTVTIRVKSRCYPPAYRLGSA
ncbi:hypothetical protein GBA52_022961 [Prunus armeniaca]|nr:hypothetical protein GBA52_022961 [Prunus armeniaca]